MKQVFQVIFCICSVLGVLAAFFLGVFLGFLYALIGVCAALFFLCLTLFMKYGNPFRRDVEEPKTDFMLSDKENERIRSQHPSDGDGEVQS